MKIFSLSGITQTFILISNEKIFCCCYVMLSTFDVNIPNGSMRENIRKNGCWVWKWFWLSCCFVHCLVSMYVIMWMIWGKYVCLLCCWWWWWWMTVDVENLIDADYYWLLRCCLLSVYSVYRVCVGVGEVCAGAGVWWCGWLWMQGCWMQNRTVQSLAAAELACPPSVTPVVMQLQSEEGRNISLKCRVTGQYRH